MALLWRLPSLRSFSGGDERGAWSFYSQIPQFLPAEASGEGRRTPQFRRFFPNKRIYPNLSEHKRRERLPASHREQRRALSPSREGLPSISGASPRLCQRATTGKTGPQWLTVSFPTLNPPPSATNQLTSRNIFINIAIPCAYLESPGSVPETNDPFLESSLKPGDCQALNHFARNVPPTFDGFHFAALIPQ